ncbi:RNA-directed DNA polymerase [Tanacetum coccineum]
MNQGPFQQYSINNGYLSRGARICIPLSSLHEAIKLESHAGGLSVYLGRDKTLDLIHDRFYWPRIERYVNRVVEWCWICHIVKAYGSNAGLYTPLSVFNDHWKDVSLVFVLGLPRKSPSKVVYGRNPITPLELVHIPETKPTSGDVQQQATYIKQLHQQVHEQILHHNKQFPAGSFEKLKPRFDGPFHVLQKVNYNAYKLEIRGHCNVSATFNVVDLSPL